MIELDQDEWKETELAAQSLSTSAVPVFFVVDADGKGKGPKVDGGA